MNDNKNEGEYVDDTAYINGPLGIMHGRYTDGPLWTATMLGDGTWLCDDERILTILSVKYDASDHGWGPFGGAELALREAAVDFEATIEWIQPEPQMPATYPDGTIIIY
ncbi:hypothetical protein [Zavarzinella formosa]|uniref:hypothetical protein n=1 Tax=Zavarzinella formosa TaxID=360055 RepID=UPI000301A36A|nr:hypothetical protein [Zavarzinella formosa]